jgi:hypothetical protein
MITEEQIKHMVERFLAWRLPMDFQPDGYITFERRPLHETRVWQMPSGTNLLNYPQAEAMVRHLVEGMPE